MSKNISDLPYTEIVERGMNLGRLPGNATQKFRGVVQDVYVREITTKFDWNFLMAESSITTTAEYKQGSITINTGATAATFSSDVVLDASFTGRRIKIFGNDVVYGLSFTNTTAATLAPSFQSIANISAGAYSIFQPYYALATDFDRFLTDGGVDKWIGGKRDVIKDTQYSEFRDKLTSTTSIPEALRLFSVDTAGNQVIEFTPPPKDARNYAYTYIRKLAPLRDSTAGTVTISAATRTVTGDTNCRFTEMNTGAWFRIDNFGTAQDSSWYRVIAIAHDSSLTLATTFANSGATTAAYTISSAPEMPSRMHPAVLFGAIRNALLDQSDENALVYNMKMAEVLSDGKRIYVSRPYSQDVHTIAEDFNYRR